MQGLRQFRAAVLQLVLVMQREISEETLAFWQKINQDFATIRMRPMPRYKSRSLQAIDQFDRAMMLQLHALGEVTDGRAQVRR